MKTVCPGCADEV